MAAWCNQLLNYVQSLRILPGRGYNLHPYPKGVALDFATPGSPSTPGQSIDEYQFVSHGLDNSPGGGTNDTDYIFAVPVGSDPSVTPVKILKPYLLRFSIKFRDVGGQHLVYSGWDPIAQSRVATNLKGSVTQFIVPMYAPGDLLLVSKVGKDLRDLNADDRTFGAPAS